jgi:hypothetical protein
MGKEDQNEGSFICQTDLRKMQSDQKEGQRTCNLRKPEAQTEAGLIL